MSAKGLTPQVPGELPKGDEEIKQDAPVVSAGDAELTKAERAELKALRAKAKAAEANDSGLPDQKDIDPTKIPRSVMTKQGWVVPHNPDAPFKGLR